MSLQPGFTFGTCFREMQFPPLQKPPKKESKSCPDGAEQCGNRRMTRSGICTVHERVCDGKSKPRSTCTRGTAAPVFSNLPYVSNIASKPAPTPSPQRKPDASKLKAKK